MTIQKNSRQMPTNSVVREKKYCDLLYAWLQCHSERVTVISEERRIHSSMVKWVDIERDFTKVNSDGTITKVMDRRTIAKYFGFLKDKGLVWFNEEDNYYYLAKLNNEEANLIEYNTLVKMMNTLQRNTISVYVYLFNRYYANSCQPFMATMRQIKDYVGIASSTTSNNSKIDDIIDILERLGLLKMEVKMNEGKTFFYFLWVKNELPRK